MCQATVYMIADGEKREIMREVARMTWVEGGVRLQQLFEEPQIVQGRVQEIDFMKHTVTLVSAESQGERGNGLGS